MLVILFIPVCVEYMHSGGLYKNSLKYITEISPVLRATDKTRVYNSTNRWKD